MRRSNLFLKIELEHDREENAQRLADEICRQIAKMYGVRSAEVANLTVSDESSAE